MMLANDTIETLCTLARQATPMATVKLVQLVESLPAEQKAELMALLWTGRDGGDFAAHLDRAKIAADDSVGYYLAEQGEPLAGYLQRGMGRINRG